MYTNAGMLAMMKLDNVIANYELVNKNLEDASSGAIAMSELAFDNHRRWQEDMNAYFIRKAEQMGLTNVRNGVMKL